MLGKKEIVTVTEKSCILHDWVTELELKHQAKLLPVLRGCDAEHHNLKKVTKMLRWLIGKNFVKTTKYSDDIVHSENDVSYWIVYHGNIESKHWFDHVIIAIEVIKQHHPDTYTRHYWGNVYNKLDIYKKLPNHIYRLLKEANDLNSKIDNLKNWLANNAKVDTADTTISETIMTQHEQLLVMCKYSELIHGNISTYCKSNNLSMFMDGVIDIRC